MIVNSKNSERRAEIQCDRQHRMNDLAVKIREKTTTTTTAILKQNMMRSNEQQQYTLSR